MHKYANEASRPKQANQNQPICRHECLHHQFERVFIPKFGCFLLIRLLGSGRIAATSAGDVLQTAVVLDSLDALDVVAGLGDAPHGLVPGRWVVVVQSLGAQVVPEGGGGDVGLVEGHLVEEMVGDVGGTDLVMEEVEDAVGAVDGGEGALDPGPFVGTVLRDGGVGVLQPGVEDEPGVGPHVGAEVPKSDGEETVVHAQLDEEGEGGQNGGRGERDLAADLGGEHLGSRAVVVHELPVLEELAVVS